LAARSQGTIFPSPHLKKQPHQASGMPAPRYSLFRFIWPICLVNFRRRTTNLIHKPTIHWLPSQEQDYSILLSNPLLGQQTASYDA
jgi:hypothetical protein